MSLMSNSLFKSNELLKSPLSINSLNNTRIDIKEKNIFLLKEKIKNQEQNIAYLNERLKNYDESLDEIIKLNQEIKRLNLIIKDKNNIIYEYQKLSDLAKNKIEQIRQKNIKINEIKNIEGENNKLNKVIKEKTEENIKIGNDCNKLKEEFNIFKKENEKLMINLNQRYEELKQNNWILMGQIKEKNIKLKEMEVIIDKLKKQLNKNKAGGNNEKNLFEKKVLTKKSKHKNIQKNNSMLTYPNNSEFNDNNFNNTYNRNEFYNLDTKYSSNNKTFLTYNYINNNKISNLKTKNNNRNSLNNIFNSPLEYNNLLLDKLNNINYELNYN